MRRVVRFALVVVFAIWVWRFLVSRHQPDERAGVSYSDGSSLVLEPGSPGFERLAGIARGALVS